MKNNIREILDKTDINVLDEINILEYIDELENKIDEAIEYIKANMEEEYIHTDYIYTMIKILRGEK